MSYNNHKLNFIPSEELYTTPFSRLSLSPFLRQVERVVSVVVVLLQALLEVVNDLFEEQTDLEKIVRKIMQRAVTLLQCERCSVLLLEDIHSPVRLTSPLFSSASFFLAPLLLLLSFLSSPLL